MVQRTWVMIPSDLITTSFTAESTAYEVLRDVNLKGVLAKVTAGSSAIESETARSLTAAGAEVTLAANPIGLPLPFDTTGREKNAKSDIYRANRKGNHLSDERCIGVEHARQKPSG